MVDFRLQFMNFCSASQRVGKIVQACDHLSRSRAPRVNRAILPLYIYIPGMHQGSKIRGGQVVMRRAAAAWRRLLICQNLGGQLPPLPPRLVHPCFNIKEMIEIHLE